MSTEPTSHQSRSRDLALLLAFSVLLLGVGLGVRDLWNPNEPTYGRVVVEMVESGDWLVPQLNGVPFVEKPILYYWLAAGASTLLGDVSHVSLRAPVFLASVACVLFVFLLIELYDGRRRALIGSGLFATLYVVWFTARNGQMDSFVMLSTLWVLYALVARLDHDWSGGKAWLLAGIGAGLGFAAKGPVAILVPGMVLFCYMVVARRPWRRLLSGLPLGLVSFAVLASPWYLGLYLSGQTEALYEMLIRQNFARFVSAWDHQQPWWYYLKYFWLTFAPWSWFVPVAAVSALRRREVDGGRAQVLAWVWLIVPMVFFSLSESKREPYMLPVAPAIAWLVARLLDRLFGDELPRWQARACTAVSATVGTVMLLGGAAVLWSGKIDAPGLEDAVRWLGITLLALAVVVLGTLVSGRTRRHGPAGVWVAFVLLYAFLALYAHREANPLKSHRPIARELEERLPDGGRLYSFLGARRALRGGYSFYMQRTIPDLVDEERLRRTWADDPVPCVLYEKPEYRDLIEGLPDARAVYEGRVGSRSVHLVCADRGPGEVEPREVG